MADRSWQSVIPTFLTYLVIPTSSAYLVIPTKVGIQIEIPTFVGLTRRGR
jgi:hypothetical protein